MQKLLFSVILVTTLVTCIVTSNAMLNNSSNASSSSTATSNTSRVKNELHKELYQLKDRLYCMCETSGFIADKYEALEKEYLERFNILLEKGIDPNAHDEHGNTPLMYAALGGNISFIKSLLDHQADPNQVDDDGKKALDYAKRLADKVSLVLNNIELLTKQFDEEFAKNGASFDEHAKSSGLMPMRMQQGLFIQNAVMEQLGFFGLIEFEYYQKNPWFECVKLLEPLTSAKNAKIE